MPKGYRSAGADFDDLFDPDTMGDGPTFSSMRSGGTPLRYAAVSYGSKRADVGYRQNGQDVSNLWAAKGTARYVSDGGLPGILDTSVVVGPAGGTADVEFNFRRDGIVTWTDSVPGQGTWEPGGGSPGDQYDVRYTLLSAGTGGTLSGVDNTWKQVNTNRFVALSLTASGGASRSTFRVVRIEIRRRADNATVVDRQVRLVATITTDG